MFNWFRSPPECPVNPATREWIDGRWKWLEFQFGVERLQSGRVILPRPEFFPDPFRGSEDDARRMLDRVCGYMDLDPATVELTLYGGGRPAYDGEWRPGTAGLYQADGDKHRIWVEVGNLHDPVAMVGTLARELGHVHLLGHGRIEDIEDHEPLTDLLTVYLGMGVFLANSVIREHYWDAGHVSGWSMGRRGYLDMPAFGYAFARFARARGEDGSEWAHELRLDVRTAFKEAMRYLAEE
jgi:hypothetical protein